MIEVHGSFGLPFGGSAIGVVLNLDPDEELTIFRKLYALNEAGEPLEGRELVLHVPPFKLFGCKVRIVTDG